jgi:hypothetical protein
LSETVSGVDDDPRILRDTWTGQLWQLLTGEKALRPCPEPEAKPHRGMLRMLRGGRWLALLPGKDCVVLLRPDEPALRIGPDAQITRRPDRLFSGRRRYVVRQSSEGLPEAHEVEFLLDWPATLSQFASTSDDLDEADRDPLCWLMTMMREPAARQRLWDGWNLSS